MAGAYSTRLRAVAGSASGADVAQNPEASPWAVHAHLVLADHGHALAIVSPAAQNGKTRDVTRIGCTFTAW